MSADDLVSVLIPSYNHEAYVEECVRSIMAQTYRNIELIVIDDGSKDGTFAKLQELKPECEKRFSRVVMIRENHNGIAKNLNTMIDMAKGSYICLIASDDMLKPQCMEKLHSFLAEHPDYVLAVGDNEIVNSRSERIFWGDYRKVLPESEALYKTVGDELRINPDNNNHPDFGGYADLLKGNYIPNGFLVRSSVYEKTGKYNPDITPEDWHQMLQFAKFGKFMYFPEILCSYRWHEKNTMQSEDYLSQGAQIYRRIYEVEKEYCFTHGYKKQWKKLWSKNFGWRRKWKNFRRRLGLKK